jgi:pilus assembly protein CpaB
VAGGFGTPEEVIGRGTTSLFVPNEPITEIKLAPLASGAGLAPMIPEGMRAMSVRVNDIVGVSGWVVPGSRVDLICTLRTGDDSISKIVLNNLEVLASGPFTDQATAREDGTARPTNVVTVIVTPQDGEKLTLASNVGSIVMALRNPLDVEEVETRGVRTAALLAGPAPPPVRSTVNGRTRVTTPPPPPVVPPYTVETIQGASRTTQEVKRGGGTAQGSGS